MGDNLRLPQNTSKTGEKAAKTKEKRMARTEAIGEHRNAMLVAVVRLLSA